MKKIIHLLMLTALATGTSLASESASLARSLPRTTHRPATSHRGPRHSGRIARSRTNSRRGKKRGPTVMPAGLA